MQAHVRMAGVPGQPAQRSAKARLTSRALIERQADGDLILGRWDARYGAWINPHTDDPVLSILPEWPLLTEQGELALSWDPVARFDAEGMVPTLSDDEYLTEESAPADGREVLQAYAEYVSLIPLRIRRLAGKMGLWQWMARNPPARAA